MGPRLLLVAVLLLLAACAASPPEREPLPDLEEALPPPAECTFFLGEPRGVLVEEVLSGSAAVGILEAGDVIVGLDGAPTPDAATLLLALGPRAPGDTVRLRLERDGAEQDTALTLGANPDSPDRPMIGVMIRTDYESVPASAVDGEVAPGPTSRPIAIGDSIYVHDPTIPSWAETGIAVPEGVIWVSATSGIFAVEDDAIIDLATGAEVPHDGLEGWDLARVIGSIGPDLILVVTRPVEETTDEVALAAARFDPATGSTIWLSPILEGFGIPISALGSPDGEHTLVVGVSADGSEITGVEVWDGVGDSLETGELVELGPPVGWADQDTILLRSDPVVISRVSIGSGEVTEATLDDRLTDLPLFPVGDGHSLLALDGQTLVLDDLESDSEVRVLAEDCLFGRIGEAGWPG